MDTVESCIDRPDRDLVSAFEKVSSLVISDVSGSVRRAMDSGIDPVHREIEVAGTALTVEATSGDNLIIHKAITMAEPGDVLVIDGGGYTETAYLSELMCTSCQANHLAGIVLDGAFRDCEEIAATRFPLYARTTHPQGPSKRAPGSTNVTVSCGGRGRT